MKLNKKFKVLSVGMLLVVTLSSAIGCSSKQSSEGVTGSEFEKLAAEKTDAIILDLRDAKDFEKSSLKNSINIPMDVFEEQVKEQIKDKDQEILLHCNTGTRTAEASQILEKNGYTNIINSIDGVKEYEFNLQ